MTATAKTTPRDTKRKPARTKVTANVTPAPATDPVP